MVLQRKNHPANFKAKVALDALREQETSVQLSSRYGIHITQIGKWKRHLLDHVVDLFSDKRAQSAKETETLMASLYQKIGQLEVELDFLKKKSSL